VPYRRGGRDEVIELTGQDRVPVLVTGDEVVNDSHRILEHLDWAAARARRS
jgi:glutathione S-transferase